MNNNTIFKNAKWLWPFQFDTPRNAYVQYRYDFSLKAIPNKAPLFITADQCYMLYLNGKKYENYFCPEDNCKEHVIEELNKAEQSIYFMTFSFTDEDIADTLIKKSKTMDVRGIMEAKRVNMQYNQYKRLVNNSIKIKKDTNPYTMHHKVFIIDNKTTITGSYNPTGAGNEKNDENILIINNRNITQRFLEEFDYLTSLE